MMDMIKSSYPVEVNSLYLGRLESSYFAMKRVT